LKLLRLQGESINWHYVHATKNKFVLIAFTFTMPLVMVAINKTLDYFICQTYLLHHNKKYYYHK